MGENPANHVFVDLDLKRQGNLLSDSRTAPAGITLLHFDYRTDEFCARTFRAGLTAEIRGEQHPVLLLAQGFVKRSEEHTSELQSQSNLVCRLLLEKKKKIHTTTIYH